MGTVNIVIAARSFGIRSLMARNISQFPDFQLTAQTRDLMETFSFVEDHPPHLVMLEQALSFSPEFEVMRALFETLDIRWVLVAPDRHDGGSGPDRRRSLIAADLFEIDLKMPPERIADTIRTITRMSIRRAPKAAPTRPKQSLQHCEKIILIGASTGGVDALLTVLQTFPAECPPTLIVQHTGAGFGSSLIALLDRQCRPNVAAPNEGEKLSRGQVIVAAGLSAHMQIAPHSADANLEIEVRNGPPISGHCPSVDSLFLSAVPLARRVVAVLLTGMGRDGADGLLALRKAGATTFAQDSVTSVVYGMPRAAIEAGAAQHVLPLPKIGDALLRSCAPINPSTRAALT